ncbi:unnamed protein product, partial [Mesorhabditis belari]|uniref:DNA topoisomerase 2 n=1 Tax=Mesorhabditis belari TaxID=2138241 RepID=A0AAF3FJC7_9BILA
MNRGFRVLFYNFKRSPLLIFSSGISLCAKQCNKAKTKTGLALDLSAQYKKYDLREHVLARPDMYVGTKEICQKAEWILDGNEMKQEVLTYPPALLKLNSFSKYVHMHLPEGLTTFRQHPDERWEVHLAPSLDKNFQQISFVNNVNTTKGGRHVEHVMSQVVEAIRVLLEKKGKKGIRSGTIRSHLWLFLNSIIENPSFQAQTKEELATEVKKFGSKFVLNGPAVQKWAIQAGIIEEILSGAEDKKRSSLRARDLATEIPRLEDAEGAGKSKRQECTLIITEGESAKALAIAGLEVVGRELYGVLPIRGRLINVKDNTEEKVFANDEVKDLCTALGLERSLTYSTPQERKRLRYGRLLLFADQDEDGSHIKALVINLIQHFWPELLRNGFIASFVTPLIKARLGNQIASFYSRREFDEWALKTADHAKWTIKYYKGLGTSTSKEAKEYFSNLDSHVIPYRWEEGDDAKFDLAFTRNRAAARKEWILQRNQETNDLENPLSEKLKRGVTFSEFIDDELYQYSVTSLKRSIPSVMDGLKPSQRKILYTCLRGRDGRKEWKVSQLAGMVAHRQSYHHGEAALESAIVRLAQNFVGANNVPLLLPVGQFGTRAEGGDDAASARYIYVQISPISDKLFPAADELSLTLTEEENQKAEPKWLCPLIPTVLLNGCDGLATGWSTSVLSYRPNAIINNVRRLIEGKELEKMEPWFRGFNGQTFPTSPDYRAFNVLGKIQTFSKDKNFVHVKITELPLGVWTQHYKEKVLSNLVEKGYIRNLSQKHTENSVHFDFDMMKGYIDVDDEKKLISTFKLSTIVSARNMVLFNPSQKLHHYLNTDEIFHDHFVERERFYKERIQREIKRHEIRLKTLQNQVRFVQGVVEKTIDLHDDNIIAGLIEKGFDSDPQNVHSDRRHDFGYLANMPNRKFRRGEIAKLEDEMRTVQRLHDATGSMTAKQEWLQELDQLEKEFAAQDKGFKCAEMHSKLAFLVVVLVAFTWAQQDPKARSATQNQQRARAMPKLKPGDGANQQLVTFLRNLRKFHQQGRAPATQQWQKQATTFCSFFHRHPKCQNGKKPKFTDITPMLAVTQKRVVLQRQKQRNRMARRRKIKKIPKLQKRKNPLDDAPAGMADLIPDHVKHWGKMKSENRKKVKGVCARIDCKAWKAHKQKRDHLRGQMKKFRAKVKAPDQSDDDIELELDRTRQLKKALLEKAELDTDVDPADDGVFDGDLLLTKEQSEYLLNELDKGGVEEEVGLPPGAEGEVAPLDPSQDPDYDSSIAGASLDYEVETTDPPDAGMVQPEEPQLSRMARAALFFEQQYVRKWDNTRPIPYTFHESLESGDQQTVRQALQTISNNVPCLRFQYVSAPIQNGYFLYYMKTDAPGFCGLSRIGKVTGGNEIYLSFTCNGNIGVTIHETMHSLGVDHQHIRMDRDKWITVNWGNVNPQMYDSLAVSDAKTFTTYGVPYDYASVMHYNAYTAAVDYTKPTLIPIYNADANIRVMGQRDSMTKRDVEILNKMYCKPANCYDTNVYCGHWALDNQKARDAADQLLEEVRQPLDALTAKPSCFLDEARGDLEDAKRAKENLERQ